MAIVRVSLLLLENFTGDPLLPYLFLFCVEGISHKINMPSLQGLSVSHRGPAISHLLFADDSFYAKESLEKAEIIRQILHDYSAVCGQTVNLNKSSLIFSANTPTQFKKEDCSSFKYHQG